MQAYFMRHGQTNYNVLGLCNDDPTKNVHLTALGRQQAQTAAQQLTSVPLDQIIVSELPRTRQTAEIVNDYRQQQVPIQIHPAINDIRTGFDSCPVTEYFAAVGTHRLQQRPPGGESLLDYQARVWRFLDWLPQQPWQTVLVVAHEETLRVVMARYRGLADTVMENLVIGNCELVDFTLMPDTENK